VAESFATDGNGNERTSETGRQRNNAAGIGDKKARFDRVFFENRFKHGNQRCP